MYARDEALMFAITLPTVNLSSRECGDLIMFGIGGFTPLHGLTDQA